jgi:outer membrane protein OmpA-like peptidoglycan-associated protein
VRRAIVLLVVVGACAGTELKERTATVDQQIATARDNGALRCAPVELAMAESHNDFAKTELAAGHYYPAKDELAIAETNAKAAVDKSPRERCVPPKVVPIGDKDGDGILDNVDQCPNDPEDFDGYQDADGCPDPDNDADGIPDKDDKCPNDPEDKDGFQDADGCPDPDNDGDGIGDHIDQCPDQPEDKDGFQDEDGCPDPDNDGDGIPDTQDKCPNEAGPPPDGCPQKYTLIVVTENKIELKQTVFFDTNKATIKKVSFELLNQVAQALKDNPTIQVRIEGHTDSQGNDDFNMKLSQRRAESVRTYLIGKGIAGDRMVPQGYGETVPIADNRTSAGRAQNRRVEFVITSR